MDAVTISRLVGGLGSASNGSWVEQSQHIEVAREQLHMFPRSALIETCLER